MGRKSRLVNKSVNNRQNNKNKRKEISSVIGKPVRDHVELFGVLRWRGIYEKQSFHQ